LDYHTANERCTFHCNTDQSSYNVTMLWFPLTTFFISFSFILCYDGSAGGGCKKLFRKVGDRSSEFYPEINDIRRDGSYIYEEFIETQGTDVKMYTVGPDYGHAEARKSPTVDGKVERNEDGKEVRFPVILTLREKEIARR